VTSVFSENIQIGAYFLLIWFVSSGKWNPLACVEHDLGSFDALG
jgi:hypothetical protein